MNMVRKKVIGRLAELFYDVQRTLADDVSHKVYRDIIDKIEDMFNEAEEDIIKAFEEQEASEW